MTDVPPGMEAPQPASRPTQPPRPLMPVEGRPVSFYLAIFLALLLFVSGGLNLVLLFVSAIGSATGGFAGSYAEESDGMYEMVAVGGDSDAKGRILRVPIVGAIAEIQSPVIGAVGGTVSQVRRALRAAAKDDTIKGVLFDINSPGGGVTDSDELHRLISEFRRDHDKPVLALFGDISASGGYYMAVACERIMARPTTITGSIGVIMQSYNVARAVDKLGISPVTIISPSTPYKDILSMTRDMRPEEREILTSIVQELYDRFVTVVDDGRPSLDRDAVAKLADGRIYSAQQAHDSGLIDAIGTIDDAYAMLRDMCSADALQVIEQRRRPGLGDLLFGARSAVPSLEQSAVSLLGSMSAPRFLYYWTGAR